MKFTQITALTALLAPVISALPADGVAKWQVEMKSTPCHWTVGGASEEQDLYLDKCREHCKTPDAEGGPFDGGHCTNVRIYQQYDKTVKKFSGDCKCFNGRAPAPGAPQFYNWETGAYVRTSTVPLS
ncbi:hypothetical protein HRG_011133 [Hirsutella rhossiliensis]|uniref:Uncharacterized protein n=1 Tax=Hirsutella rhossiliensis TaxID=111463 RepID=A0A9P8MR06_9HYPO|nr:uncharacterized protein HRG_11133 [Hirsutella rhossiliensis]KAH0957642.1 hypothetical protein HRG_11133 [Hirsutella rhossiliensis]